VGEVPGVLGWLGGYGGGGVCLEETRAELAQLSAEVIEPQGWHVRLCPASAKGRAGVALYSRREPDAVRVGFGVEEFDGAGRYVEADLGSVTVASLYLPSGEVGTERQQEKERFMKSFLPYLVERRAQVEAQGRDLVVGGDWNMAHTEAELKNWRNNRGHLGVLAEQGGWGSRVFG